MGSGASQEMVKVDPRKRIGYGHGDLVLTVETGHTILSHSVKGVWSSGIDIDEAFINFTDKCREHLSPDERCSTFKIKTISDAPSPDYNHAERKFFIRKTTAEFIAWLEEKTRKARMKKITEKMSKHIIPDLADIVVEWL